MKYKRLYVFLCIMFLFIGITSFHSLAADSKKHQKLPDSVVAEIQSLEAECRDGDSVKPIKTNFNVVKMVDLNGDGLLDYVIDDRDIYCELGESSRHGNGGTGIIIFAGIKDGGAIKAFDKTVWDISIKKAGKRSVAWATVGGHYCGQDNFKSRSDAIICYRSLVWNKSSNEFEFSPLSQAKICHASLC